MAKRIRGITIELEGETKGLDKALGNVNKRSQDLNSELKQVERALKFNPGNTDLIAQQQEVLSRQIENSTEKLDQLRNAQRQVERQFQSGDIGEEEYRAFQREIIKTESQLREFEQQLESVDDTKSLSNTEEDMRDVKSQTDKAERSAQDLGDSFKTVAKHAAGIAVGAGAAIGGLVEGMDEYNSQTARLGTNASLQGLDPSKAEDYANRVAVVSGEMDSAVETISNLMATDMTDSQMAQAIDEVNGAAIKFSDTLRTEGIADGLQETFATGEAVGQFGELLERSGVDLDKFNSGLQQAQSQGEATNYILQQMSDLGLSEASDKFEEMNPELVANREAQQRLTEASADLATVLTPLVASAKSFMAMILEWVNENIKLVQSFDNIGEGLQALLGKLVEDGSKIVSTLVSSVVENLPQLLQMGQQMLQNIITGIMNNVPMLVQAFQQLIIAQSEHMSEFLPRMLEMGVQLLQGLVTGLLNALPFLIESALQLVNNMVQAILESIPLVLQAGTKLLLGLLDGIILNLPKILETVLRVLRTLVNNIVDNLPMIIEAGISLLNSLIDGIISILPQLMDTALNLVSTVLDIIVQNLPMIIDAGVQLLLSLIDGILNALPDLISTALQLVIELAAELLANLPKILAAGVDIILSLIEGIIQAIPDLIAAIPEVVQSIFDAFGEVDWSEIGEDIMNGLKSGIQDMAGSVARSAERAAKNAVDGVKNFLGISSPSKVFTTIGHQSGEGLEKGLRAMGNRVSRAGERLASDSVPNPANIGVNETVPGTQSNALDSSEVVALLKDIAMGVREGRVLTVDDRELGRATEPHVSEIQDRKKRVRESFS